MLLGINCMETFTSATSRDLKKTQRKCLEIIAVTFLNLRINTQNMQHSTFRYRHRITLESFRLEKTLRSFESNCQKVYS